jgi:uncharacterized protein (TIGR03067 family)
MYPSLLLTVALSLMAPGPKEEPKKDAGKLDGEWLVVTFEGGPEKKDGVASVRFQFTDGKIVVHEAGRDRKENAAFTADYTKKLPEIDIRPSIPGADNDKVVKGVFKITGDKLELCFSKGDSAERPTELKAVPEKGIVLITMKRIKPE